MNSIFSSAAAVRLSPVEGPFRPYVEALVGFNYLFTNTSVHDEGDVSGDIATTTNFDDWAFTWGQERGPSSVLWRSEATRGDPYSPFIWRSALAILGAGPQNT